MSRLCPVSWNELIRKLHALGFDGPYTGKGPHPLMWKGTIRVMIPNPHRADVGVDLQAGRASAHASPTEAEINKVWQELSFSRRNFAASRLRVNP